MYSEQNHGDRMHVWEFSSITCEIFCIASFASKLCAVYYQSKGDRN